MSGDRSERLYLADIRDAIDRILDYTSKGRHDYFRTDLEVVWDVVTNDLPPLREQIDGLLATA